MTYTDAWIEKAAGADLELVGLDPHEAGASDRSPFFPEATKAYSLLRRGVESGSLKGFPIDWGSYAAIMNRNEIEELLVETHGVAGTYEAAHAGLPDSARKMRELREFVAALPEGKWFKVVVEEY